MCQATARKGGVGSKLGRRSDDGVISSVPVPHLSMKSCWSLCLLSFESHAIPPDYRLTCTVYGVRLSSFRLLYSARD